MTKSLRRRSLFALCGTALTTGALAGCLETSPTDDSANTTTHPHVDDGVVDYRSMVDGEATVEADEQPTIEYDDPEETFTFDPIYRGDVEDDENLIVSRDLSSETMTAFIAPIADPGDGFEYHVFANEPFVEFADWLVYVETPDGELEEVDGVTFEHYDDVSHMSIDSSEASAVVLVETDLDPIGADEEDVTGVALIRESQYEPPEETTPNVHFDFDYDVDDERLVVMHQAGDSVEVDRIAFRTEGADVEVVEPFDGTVSAGHSATLDVPPNATVRVVWEGDRRSVVLSEWSDSDA